MAGMRLVENMRLLVKDVDFDCYVIVVRPALDNHTRFTQSIFAQPENPGGTGRQKPEGVAQQVDSARDAHACWVDYSQCA